MKTCARIAVDAPSSSRPAVVRADRQGDRRNEVPRGDARGASSKSSKSSPCAGSRLEVPAGDRRRAPRRGHGARRAQSRPPSRRRTAQCLSSSRAPFADGPALDPDVLVRLVVAALLGAASRASIARRGIATDVAPTFPVTLVLLSVLIAMVHAGHRRQRRARVQPGRRAVHRPVPHRRPRHAGYGVRDLCRRRRHGRWRARPDGRAHRHRRRRRWRRC